MLIGPLSTTLRTRPLETLTKTSPPYALWDKSGERRVRIALQCQDEFFPDWQKRMETTFGFTQVKKGVYERRDVVDGKTTVFTVRLTETERDMFAPMADEDTDVVMWCGHSDWWARIARDLKTAPKPSHEKVFINFMCFGRHFLDDIVSAYPSAHVITTKDPTEDTEDRPAFKEILRGFAHGSDWQTIARAVTADKKHNPDDNFIFPCDLKKMSYVLDTDGDGRVDLLDRRFDRPKHTDAARAVLESGLLLNSLSYDHELLDRTNRSQRVRADGFFHAEDDRAIRLTKDGEITRLAVSDELLHATPATIVGLAVFEGVRALLPAMPAADKALYALAAVAHATDNDRYPDGPAVYREVIARYGLPKLPRKKVLALVEADMRWESGSKKTLAGIKKLLRIG